MSSEDDIIRRIASHLTPDGVFGHSQGFLWMLIRFPSRMTEVFDNLSFTGWPRLDNPLKAHI